MEKRSVALGCADGTFDYGGEKLYFFPSIGLKLTGACRFGCPFCCEPDRSQDMAPIENFINLTNTLRQFGTRRLCFTGGDPLLYPGIGQLLKHTRSLGFYNLLLTTDGELLNKHRQEVLPFVNAVRFSVHAIHSQHDEIVGYRGSFVATEEAIDILSKEKIPSFVTTVVTSLNIDFIPDVAEWCLRKKVKKYFLFGLMRSGLGECFIEEHGEVSPAAISAIIAELKRKYSREQMEIIYYDYSNNAECILIYGDGRVVIDPYPDSKSFQLEIGNIFSGTRTEILGHFFQDPKNCEGYRRHLEMYNDALT
jgi:MoaA/NifB/PqqE/SkfB family radical SAM enzyme